MKNVLKSNFTRTLLCMALVVTMLLGNASTALALGGVETWSGSDTSDVFPVNNNNLTPRKTMGSSGNLYLWVKFAKSDGKSSDVELHVEVRNLTTGKTDSVYFYNADMVTEQGFNVYVSRGDVIQIYFDVCTRSGQPKPGGTRSANVQYGYRF